MTHSGTAYEVVIPAFNATRTLGETLCSVLAQTVPPVRVLVIDDGSSDDTAAQAAAHDPRVVVVTQANAGPGPAMTRGLAEVRTPVVATVDADDLWVPHKMERQLAALRQSDSKTFVASRQRQFRHGQPDQEDGEVRSGINRSSLVMWTELARSVGPVITPPGMRGDLVDWLARARSMGIHMLELPDVLVLRRILPGSLSYGRDAAKDAGYLSIAHAALLRRRAVAAASVKEQS